MVKVTIEFKTDAEDIRKTQRIVRAIKKIDEEMNEEQNLRQYEVCSETMRKAQERIIKKDAVTIRKMTATDMILEGYRNGN